MSRTVPLTAINGGISRLRVKGAARADTLYDLVNGYVTEQATVVNREGTSRETTLPSTTRGLVYFDSAFHTFSHQVEDVPDGYVSHVLTHPTDPEQTLSKIHFAKPYLGALYVVAEFANGDVRHFWLAQGGVWEANKIYKAGDVVLASEDTGLLYRATRATPANQAWAPNVLRAVNDVVEPTTYNDFYYTVISVQGANPRSGTVEPTWPEESGATVIESTEQDVIPSGGTTEPPADQPPQNVRDRYGRIIT